ncbi:MAG: hypothetical protein ACRYFX_02655 [Janthinobacterium lividum]
MEKNTVKQLEEKYGTSSIPYSKLLLTKEWDEARKKVIGRDGCVCKNCGRGSTESSNGNHFWLEWVVVKLALSDADARQMEPEWRKGDAPIEVEAEGWEAIDAHKPYHLEVHHKYYVFKNYPWEYPDDALVTLCNWCHQDVHDTTVIPVYSHTGEALGYTPCHRCNGSGSFPEYSHVQSGVCFRCGGARYEELIQK